MSVLLQSAYALESPTNAEIIRQQQRLEEQTRLATLPNVRLQVDEKNNLNDKKNIVIEESPCFLIKKVSLVLENASKENAADYLFALKPIKSGSQTIIGKCLGTQSIRNVANAVQNELIAKGYITTQVAIKPQDLNSHELVVSIFLGRVNALLRTPETSERVQLYNALPINPDDVLNLRDIEQGLENFRRLSGVNVDIQIAPANKRLANNSIGEKLTPQNTDGYSDLIVDWQQQQWFSYQIGLDDSGSESTGKYIGSAGLNIEDPLQINDVLNLSYSQSLEKPDNGNNKNYYAAYKVPYDHWLLATNYSQYRYEQKIPGLNAPIIYSGISKQINVNLSRLLSRGQNHKTLAHYKFYRKQVKSFIDDFEVDVQRRQTAGWQAGITHRQFIGNSILNISIDYQRGTGAFQAMQAPEELFGEGKSKPIIVSGDIALTIPFNALNQQWQYRANWRGQRTPSVLVPQDRFSIGGRYSVRGFDGEYTLAGDNGHLLQHEIGWNNLIQDSQLYLGIDQGWVSGPNTQYIAGRYLAGAVLGLRGYVKGFSFDWFAGRGIKAPRGIDQGFTSGFSVSWGN